MSNGYTCIPSNVTFTRIDHVHSSTHQMRLSPGTLRGPSGIGTESRPTLHLLARLFFAAGGEPSSEHYFMDKPLLTEACGVVSDAEIVVITWDLPHVITITLRLVPRL